MSYAFWCSRCKKDHAGECPPSAPASNSPLPMHFVAPGDNWTSCGLDLEPLLAPYLASDGSPAPLSFELDGVTCVTCLREYAKALSSRFAARVLGPKPGVAAGPWTALVPIPLPIP